MFLTPPAINQLRATLGTDLLAFLPEILVCGTIVLMLLLRLLPACDRYHLGGLAQTLTVLALFVSWLQWNGAAFWDPRGGEPSRELFTGLLVYDNFTIFLRIFLLTFAALVIWLSLVTGLPDALDSADFYTQLLGATVGMMLMASANHLIMFFIAVEMASLPSYGLAGFLKGKRRSSEAALKYVVYGGGAAGVMLYGISLIAGKFGTGYLPDLAQVLPRAASEPGIDLVLLLGLLFIMIGLAFKISAVPFHFWCPDVFEGAAAEVAGFLSVASKGAALALLARFGLTLLPGLPAEVHALTPSVIPALAFLAALTATFGNLAAYPQTNLKRLLAYSTIAHAGYMLMGLATLTAAGVSAVLFYLVVYLFMNLGAFAVVAFLRNLTGSEELGSFRGLVYRSPLVVVLLAVFLLSLVGLPPLAGFAAKFQIFRVLFDAAQSYNAQPETEGLGTVLYALLMIGGLNTVFSLVYYLRVLKVMVLDKPLEEMEGKPVEPMPLPYTAGFFGSLLALMILVLGVFFSPLAT
ncbi:MAG: NADH-quinone oxidoreductase subunit N, partial [Gemmataceae bacterium]|nr:NADH-quinone oxidoreductase subunit N [Gemmataceae bacterium]